MAGSGMMETKPLSKELLEELKKARAEAPRYALILHHAGGSQIVTLVPDVGSTLGREAPAEIAIADESLSRTHARIRLTNGEVWIEDLRSTNGTFINGKRIENARIRPGDDIAFGAVTAVLHVMAGGDAKLSGLGAHERFLALIEEDIVRANHFGRKLALVMLRTIGPVAQSAGFERIGSLLRPVDVVAEYGPGTVEILLPESSLDEAVETAKRIVARKEGEASVRVAGIAVYPGSANDADALIELARASMQEASPSRPIVSAGGDGARTLVRGGDPAQTDPLKRPLISSASMRALFESVDRLARSSIPVLIHGETGAGKEVVARALHERGPRRARSMCSVNCGAIPENLVESTLFGHEKGAFTGADQQHKGVFESADGGTVFLDEIGELPPNAQAALLRTLETKRIVRVGSTKEIPVDVRIVAATHRDLEGMCKAGVFRFDLFYRLNVMTLQLPPLRERIDEVEPFALHFLDLANAANGSHVRAIAPQAMDLLRAYDWPGNVRELKNAIERAVVIAKGDEISAADLPEGLRSRAEPAPAPSADVDRLAVEEPVPQAGGSVDFKERLRAYETSLILGALGKTSGNQTDAARLLGMPLRTLVHKIKTLGIKKLGYSRE